MRWVSWGKPSHSTMVWPGVVVAVTATTSVAFDQRRRDKITEPARGCVVILNGEYCNMEPVKSLWFARKKA